MIPGETTSSRLPYQVTVGALFCGFGANTTPTRIITWVSYASFFNPNTRFRYDRKSSSNKWEGQVLPAFQSNQ